METKQRLLEIFNQILANKGRSLVAEISEEQKLREDVGFDSLDLAELTVKVEVEFDVDIFEDGLIFTVGEILDKLK